MKRRYKSPAGMRSSQILANKNIRGFRELGVDTNALRELEHKLDLMGIKRKKDGSITISGMTFKEQKNLKNLIDEFNEDTEELINKLLEDPDSIDWNNLQESIDLTEYELDIADAMELWNALDSEQRYYIVYHLTNNDPSQWAQFRDVVLTKAARETKGKGYSSTKLYNMLIDEWYRVDAYEGF